jgi:hypothetical protein
MLRLANAAFVAAALIAPIAVTPVLFGAEVSVRTYHDSARNEDHRWDKNEDRAYRAYVKENHRRYTSFGRLKENDRSAYWGWRHDHPDASLNINIRK